MILSSIWVDSKVIFHGQTLFRLPTIKPPNTAMLRSWWRENSHFTRRTNESKPTKHPAIKTKMTSILSSCRDCRMYWYLPKTTRIKDPEMPGKIMAQMAMAPDKNTNQSALVVWAGTKVVIHQAKAIPTINGNR